MEGPGHLANGDEAGGSWQWGSACRHQRFRVQGCRVWEQVFFSQPAELVSNFVRRLGPAFAQAHSSYGPSTLQKTRQRRGTLLVRHTG